MYCRVWSFILKDSVVVCEIPTQEEVEKHKMNTISTFYFNFSSQNFEYDCRFLQEFQSEKQMTFSKGIGPEQIFAKASQLAIRPLQDSNLWT